ncbi:HTH domain-containing protein [bacterium]|nr:HTH domain-containing protein [bacterium]MCI0566230.1 HTH domain-containing protein [bacterium]MCI0680088.1 HTH domain-containing protein [bacterium]
MSTKPFNKPEGVVKKFLSVLPERTQTIVVRRFGLDDEAQKMTLEAIGDEYGITRERVRQIENFAINTIRRSDVFEDEHDGLQGLHDTVISLGAVVGEADLLSHLSDSKKTQNQLYFLLVLGDSFSRYKEDDEFVHRWSVDDAVAQNVYAALRRLAVSLDAETLIPDQEFIKMFRGHLGSVDERHKENDETLRRWLAISKMIGRNKLGEWGHASSPNVNARGMRDYAYLVIRRHGSPMHFTEVAKSITELFGKKAHVATCHNELIKDSRFVLVGRGLYVLTEWGYSSGVVRDVIRDILKKSGPLDKDELINRVLKERYVKENTILVNLQNGRHFKKGKDGRYMAAR